MNSAATCLLDHLLLLINGGNPNRSALVSVQIKGF